MGLTVTSTTEVPSTVLERAKTHMRITNDNQNESIMTYLEMAVGDFELYTSRALWNTTYKWTFADFGSCVELELPRCPAVSVASVKYYDTDGNLQTFSTSNYTVNINDDLVGTIYLKDTADWPDVDDDNPEAVEIAFTAGYGTGMADIPGYALGGLLLYAGHLMDNRDAGAIDDLDKIKMKCFGRYRARWQ